MPRPVRVRPNYQADISVLGNIRTAVQMDRRLEDNEIENVVMAVDILIERLRTADRIIEKREAE